MIDEIDESSVEDREIIKSLRPSSTLRLKTEEITSSQSIIINRPKTTKNIKRVLFKNAEFGRS